MGQSLSEQLRDLYRNDTEANFIKALRTILTVGVYYRDAGQVQYTYKELQERVQQWVPEIDKDRFEELLQQEPSL